MEFESNFKTLSPEEKIENYEKDAAKKAKEENSVFQNLLRKGISKEGRIMLDAQIEDKYRKLVKDGVLNNDELEILTRSNFRSTNPIEGFINGHDVKIMVYASTTEKGSMLEYEGVVDGKKVDSKSAEIIFFALSKEINKKDIILAKIKRIEIEGMISGK